MDPEANSLVAVVVAVCALLVVGAAAGITLLAIRLAHGASVTGHRLAQHASAVQQEGPALRARIHEATSRVERIREEWAAADQSVTDVTATLASMRGSLERLTRGRLATLIRGAGLVSKAAQLALLWR